MSDVRDHKRASFIAMQLGGVNVTILKTRFSGTLLRQQTGQVPEGVQTQRQRSESGASSASCAWTALQKSRFPQANSCENAARSLTFRSVRHVKALL